MNGIHDMGGMHGMGPIPIEKNEPIFHAHWEERVFGLVGALPPDVGPSRQFLERIPPADYLRMSYYERWLTVIVERLVTTGLITPAELERGKRARGSAKATPKRTAAQIRAEFAKRDPEPGWVPGGPPRFQAGQRVQTRNLNPEDYIRLPRYARGRFGVIERSYGVDPEDPPAEQEHQYSVRFSARELWGEQASPRDSVYIDLLEKYLEPA